MSRPLLSHLVGQGLSLTDEASPLIKRTAAVLVACLLLGGGTRPGFLSDALLELGALALLLSALWRAGKTPIARGWLWPVVFLVAVTGLPMAQLLPLPTAVWGGLPGRGEIQTTLQLVGQAPAATSLSVSPNATWLGALSLLVPVSIFVGTLMLSAADRRRLSLVVLAFGLISAVLGLLQVAQGPSSALRFYVFTNDTEAVGFFANRNHFAALTYATLLLAITWLAALASRRSHGHTHASIAQTSPGVLLAVGLLTVVALLAAEVMARSRAGLALTTVALLGAVPLMLASGRLRARSRMPKLVIGAVAVAAIGVLQFGLYRVTSRLEADPLEDQRLSLWRNTIEAAQAYMPFGSGLGTFTQVYPMFEKREDLVDETIANHAHNDFLELWLETGVAGPALAGIFVVWLLVATVAAWRRPAHAPDAQLVDRLLPRAAALIVILLVAHSAVDYPLRTNAVLALFAFCCGLLVTPPTEATAAEAASTVTDYGEPHAQPAREFTPAPAAAFAWPSDIPEPKGGAAAGTVEHGQKWGESVAWPEQWRGAGSTDKPEE